MDAGRQTRKFPGYTTTQLEAFVAAGRGNDAMVAEIAARKCGASKALVVPQIEGGKVQIAVGRL